MEELLNKYAKLIINTGVNLQKGQLLVINSPVECADFARRAAKAGFAAGAKDVKINWSDEKFAKIRYEGAAKEIFDEFPYWRRDMFMDFVDKRAAIVSISASDPSIFKEVDKDKLQRAQMASGQALLEYRKAIMNNFLRWCVVSVPTGAWAKKVFNDAENENLAVKKLWQAILAAVRIEKNNDPVGEWEKHIDYMKKATDFLNSARLVSLHYTNGLGTDLNVKLPRGHIWAGGAEVAEDKITFVANMPTEEVYTLPERNGVDGVVYASKPLIYQGNVIDGMRLKFSEGKVVEYSATRGEDILKHLLEVDEGSKYLGEVALVPHNSPISNSGILFYNTLFDENAACHLAFGKAYPTCIENGENMNSVELLRHGVNDSLVHEDFMIGTEDMEITGVSVDGREIPIFSRGNFVDFA